MQYCPQNVEQFVSNTNNFGTVSDSLSLRRLASTSESMASVRKLDASLRIKISASQLKFSNINLRYSESSLINKGSDPPIKQWWFIQHLDRSSYFLNSVFRNSGNFSITDITKGFLVAFEKLSKIWHHQHACMTPSTCVYDIINMRV